MIKLTKPQKELLLELQYYPYFKSRSASMRHSQWHRPMHKLEELGLVTDAWGPEDSMLMTQGWVLTQKGKSECQTQLK